MSNSISSTIIITVPGVVSNLMARARLTSIVITWSPPQEPNGVIVTYEVTYTVNSSNPTAMNITDISTVLTLGLNTRVSDISVRAYTSIGPGNARIHSGVSTSQLPSPREFEVSYFAHYRANSNVIAMLMWVLVEPLPDTSVNVSWENVTVPGISSYTIYYRPTSQTTEENEQSVTVPSTETSAVIDNLNTEVEYLLQVAAIAEFGGSIYSGQRSNATRGALVQPTTTSGIL